MLKFESKFRFISFLLAMIASACSPVMKTNSSSIVTKASVNQPISNDAHLGSENDSPTEIVSLNAPAPNVPLPVIQTASGNAAIDATVGAPVKHQTAEPVVAGERSQVNLPTLDAVSEKRVASVTAIENTQSAEAIALKPALSFEELNHLAQFGKLTCKNSSECEPALAMVSVVKQNGTIERCTGFLISEDEIMTNDHCIAGSVALTGKENERRNVSCEVGIYAHLIGATPDVENLTLTCNSIEYRSIQSGLNTEDYAILKLSSKLTDRSPLKLSQRGFNNLETANVFRVHMNEDDGGPSSFDGVQSKISCHASLGTYLFPLILSTQSKVMTFSACEIHGGNSGSPILNSNGEVGAILQGFLGLPADPKTLNDLQSLALDQSYGRVAVGTQIFCMKDGLSTSTGNCLDAQTPGTYFPKNYLAMSADFDLSFLPPVDENLHWSELSSPDPLQKVFVETPPCTDLDQFDAGTLIYQKGIDRSMQIEWRAKNNDKLETGSFKRVSNETFNRTEFGNVVVPHCLNGKR